MINLTENFLKNLKNFVNNYAQYAVGQENPFASLPELLEQL